MQKPHLEVIDDVAYASFWRIPAGGASSIVLTRLVHFFLFYFSAAPPLHPICTACVDHQRVPSPSRFPSPSSLLPRHIHCIALPSPVLVQCHRPLALASTLFKDLRLVVSIQTNHTCHSTSTESRNYFFPIKVFHSLSPC